jgi:phosphoserine phosphatase
VAWGIATLIAAGRLDDRLVERALGLLRELDPNADFAAWIDDGDAADLRFSTDLKAARWALDGLPQADVIVQPQAAREKKLLVADMDSTIIGQECIDELADYAGIKPQIAAITERAMQGELDFETALRERVALLGGVKVTEIARCLAERVRPNPGAATLVRTMRLRGATCLLVSGGFMSFAEPVAEQLGFDRVRANQLGVQDGLLDGLVEGDVVDAAAKRTALIEARIELGLEGSQVLAVGDGANDRLMIADAGLGIAYRAKPALAEVADARLDHHGLDALLWAQGIPRSEWVTD